MSSGESSDSRRTPRATSFHVYIARTSGDRLYVGHTSNLRRREGEHRASKFGAKFIRDSGSDFQIVYTEDFMTRGEALQREKQLKGWTRAKKEALIAGDLNLLRSL